MMATKVTIQTTIENLSKWLLDQAHRAMLTDKQFNSVLIISRARFGRDVAALLQAPVEPLFPLAAAEVLVVAKPKRKYTRKPKA